jgi:exopolysaccharide production protein ExoQ
MPRFRPGGASARGPSAVAAVLEPGKLEPWFWGLAIFLLTSPFAYQLTGVDPAVETTRNLATMRRDSGSGVLLYAIRYASALAAMVAVLPHWQAALGRLPRLWPILLFTAWASLTVTWSDTINSSLNGVLALIPLLIVGYCLALRLPPHLLARSYIYSGIWAAGFSLLYIVLLPRYGMHQANDVSQAVHAGAWRGVYPHKNLFGGLMGAYAAITILAGRKVLPSQVLRIGVIAVLLLLVVRSHSATALLLAFGAPILTWVLVTVSVPIQMLLALCAVPVMLIVVSVAEYLLGLLGRDMTFTGRTSIWEIAPGAIAKRPLGGYGFASTTYGEFMVELYRRFGLFDPHNGYLNLLLSTGIVGLCLFLLAIVKSAQAARDMYHEGAERRQAALVIFGVTAAWMMAMLSESQDKPLGSFGALGFSVFCLVVYRGTIGRQGRDVPAPMDEAPPSRVQRRRLGQGRTRIQHATRPQG